MWTVRDGALTFTAVRSGAVPPSYQLGAVASVIVKFMVLGWYEPGDEGAARRDALRPAHTEAITAESVFPAQCVIQITVNRLHSNF